MKTKKYIKSLAIGLIKYVVTGFIVAFGILAFSNKDQTLQSKKFYQQLNTNTVRI